MHYRKVKVVSRSLKIAVRLTQLGNKLNRQVTMNWIHLFPLDVQGLISLDLASLVHFSQMTQVEFSCCKICLYSVKYRLANQSLHLASEFFFSYSLLLGKKVNEKKPNKFPKAISQHAAQVQPRFHQYPLPPRVLSN